MAMLLRKHRTVYESRLIYATELAWAGREFHVKRDALKRGVGVLMGVPMRDT